MTKFFFLWTKKKNFFFLLRIVWNVGTMILSNFHFFWGGGLSVHDVEIGSFLTPEMAAKNGARNGTE